MLSSENPVSPRNCPNLMTIFTSTCVFLLSALALVIPSGYSVGPALLVLASLTIWAARPVSDIRREDLLIMGSLAVFGLVGCLTAVLDGLGSSGFDKPSRYLLAVPALLVLLRHPPRQEALWAGLALGSLGAGTMAAWQKFVAGVARADGSTNAIQFGNLSMLMGVLCLAGIGWAVTQPRRRAWLSLLILAALAGVLGSLLSGSRGGWVGIPFVLLVFYRGYGYGATRKQITGLALCLVLAVGLVYSLPQIGVQQRFHEAISNVTQYVSGEKKNTSVGYRFEMWKGATVLFLERPLLGWGDSGYSQRMNELADEGVIIETSARFGHPHNEFMDAAAKRGLLGIVALLTLYLIPMRLFAKRQGDGDAATNALATAGVLLPVAFIDYGLTQAFLSHNSGTMMYAFLLISVWAVLRQRERELEYDTA
ncbi:O-antigen ligase family protein [Halomonas salinarum]|uniref:O-antigen ligase family protein n=1 Tax=Halomonas salinarum TaxID=1158993 RepID=UPI001439C3D2|nr:O-antigen ligase family protein [Halomonas salinarum]